MAINSVAKADQLADLIGKIAADMSSLKVDNRNEHNQVLIELLGSAAVASFTDIGDVPSSYVGFGGWLLAVTSSEDGIEFIDPGTFLTTVAVDGITVIGDGTVGNPLVAVGGGGVSSFLGLTDTPGAYGGAGMLVAINGTNDGLEFINAPANQDLQSVLDAGSIGFVSTDIQMASNDGNYSTTLNLAGSSGNATMAVNDIGTNVAGGFVATIGLAGVRMARSVATDYQRLLFDANGMFITDDINTKGLEYDVDYSANFTDHSLISKLYSDTWSLYLTDNTVGSNRTATLTDTLTFTGGTTILKYGDGTNTITHGTGTNPIGFGLTGDLWILTTDTGKRDAYGGVSLTGAGNPSGPGHAEWVTQVYDGTGENACFYAGPYQPVGGDVYVSMYWFDGGPTYLGFEANPNGEQLYSQRLGLAATALTGTEGIAFYDATGYFRAATIEDLAATLPTLYAGDADLTGDRTLTGAGYFLTFTGLGDFTVEGDAINITGDNDVTIATNATNINLNTTAGGSVVLNPATTLSLDSNSGSSGVSAIQWNADNQIFYDEDGDAIFFMIGNDGVELVTNTNILSLATQDTLTYNTGQAVIPTFRFQSTAQIGNLTHEALTAARTWQLPDKDGVIALVSDIGSNAGIYGGSGSLSEPTTVTLSAVNFLSFEGGRINFKGADTLHNTLAFNVTDSADSDLFTITNGGSVKFNNPGVHEDGAFSFRSGNPTSNNTDGSLFRFEASDNTLLIDASASGGLRLFGQMDIADGVDHGCLTVSNAGVPNAITGTSLDGQGGRFESVNNVALFAAADGGGTSNTAGYFDNNVVIAGTAPVGGNSGTSRLQVTGTSTGTEWCIEAKDGSGVTGFSINNEGVGVARNYTVGTVPISVAGGIIYVTDESGGAALCYGDGTTWRRIDTGNIIS